MKKQTNDTKQIYPLIRPQSHYTGTPMETATDPSARVSAMIVAQYYSENRDKYTEEPTTDNLNSGIASQMLDHLDASVTPMTKSFQNIASNFDDKLSVLPWLQRMYQMYPQLTAAYEDGMKNISSINSDGTAIGYVNLIYGYIEETISMLKTFTDIIFADNKDAIEQMACCMLLYFDNDLSFNSTSGDQMAIKLDEIIGEIDGIIATIESTQKTLNSGIGFINSIAKMINTILKTILQTAVYGVIALLSKGYQDIIDKLEPKLNVKICGKSLIDYINFSGKLNYESAAILESTLREVIGSMKMDATVVENRYESLKGNVEFLATNLGMQTDTADSLIDQAVHGTVGYLKNINPPEDFEPTEEEKNALCNACIPLYDLIGKSVNIGITSIVTWLSSMTKQLLTLVPDLPTIPAAKFKVLAILNDVKAILKNARNMVPFSAEIESCKKQIKSIVEIDDYTDYEKVNPNPIPDDMGKSLKYRGYKDDISVMPEEFLDLIEDIKIDDNRSIGEDIKEVFDDITNDKDPSNPVFDLPQDVVETIIKTPKTIVKRIVDVKFDLIKRSISSSEEIVESDIVVTIDPASNMIKIVYGDEEIVTDINGDDVSTGTVSDIINSDPEDINAVLQMTPEQIKVITTPSYTYETSEESIAGLINAITQNPDAFTGLLNSSKDPQELLNMIFNTAEKTSKTLATSRSALARYFDNVNEAIDNLSKQ